MNDFITVISNTYIDEERKKKCMDRIADEAKKKKIVVKPSAFEIFLEQIRYISILFWIGELLFVFVIWMLFNSGLFEMLKEKEIVVAVSAAAACLGAAGISEFQKSFSYKMAELEQVCFLDLRQVWSAKLALLSAVNLLFLTCAAVNISIRTQYHVYEAAVYILVPFLISCAVYFRLLFWKAGEKKIVYISAVFIMMLVSLMPSFSKKIYEESCFWIWGTALILSVIILWMELKNVWKKMEKGEVLCLNCH